MIIMSFIFPVTIRQGKTYYIPTIKLKIYFPALLIDNDIKCNLTMIKFKVNPCRFIEFPIFL